MMSFARGGDGEPVVDPGVVGWSVAEVAIERDLKDAPVFVRDVGRTRCDLLVCDGGVVVVRW
jgi:hypothetical protein